MFHFHYFHPLLLQNKLLPIFLEAIFLLHNHNKLFTRFV